MLTMIWKMSMITLLYVLLTALIWLRTRNRPLKWRGRVIIGVIYGICAVLSTHFGVDYSHMLLNVRDMGPLSAGLFFDPVSGIIAGLIGGIERYIAGTYWGVGSYTRIACSVSTILAGFLSAAMSIYIFKRKKPSAVYAFFMGAVVEVFHMYVVFITHREDMNMAFYVVTTCSPGMIVFTGVGMAISSTVLRIFEGEWKNPFRKRREEDIPVSQRFQAWLFAVTLAILILNLLFTFGVQTNTAIQNGRDTLETVSGDIAETYGKIRQTEENASTVACEIARTEAVAIAETVERMGGLEAVDQSLLERMRDIFNVVSVTAVDAEGNRIAAAGQSPIYAEQLSAVLWEDEPSQVVMPSTVRAAAGARCDDGMIQVVLDRNGLVDALNLSGLDQALSYFHVGMTGSFDIIRFNGIITAGDHRGTNLNTREYRSFREHEDGTYFRADIFDEDALCLTTALGDDMRLLVRLPMKEVYSNRDIQTFESAFSGIILFSVIYVLISMLVHTIVVSNLLLVNQSLDRIANGNLNEVVSVRKSSEFASLSDDINQTVSVLKGYIAAAEKRMEQELEFARRIQDSALPKNFTFPRDDFEIFATMDPAKEVGGDFYDFFFVGQDHLAMVIADVSGKGIPAALFMMKAKTAIRGFAESGLSPSEILYRANNTLCEGNDAEMFVTVWLAIIDLTNGKGVAANAGHEHPAICRRDGKYELSIYRHAPAVAAMDGIPFREHEFELNPGDRLFVYTDGVPEATDADNVLFGADRMVDALNLEPNAAPEVLLRNVRREIDAFVGDAPQFDDITMLGLYYKGVNGNG